MTFALLFIAVMAPTLTVIWLVGRASDNEQLALQQVLASSRLREATLLRNQVSLITDEWRDSIENLLKTNRSEVALPKLISEGLGDAFVFEDEAIPSPTESDFQPLREHLVEIRYLAQSLGKEAAIEQIRSCARDRTTGDIYMPDGSLLRPYLLLLGIEYGVEAGVDVSDISERLVRILTFENVEKMPAAQRRFLYTKLLRMGIAPEKINRFDLASRLAYRWKKSIGTAVVSNPGKGFLVNDNLVYLSFPEYHTIWLMQFDAFEKRLLGALSNIALGEKVSVELLRPGRVVKEDPMTYDTLDMGYPMEGWRLKIGNPGLSEIGSGASQHIVLYMWVGALAILLSVVLIFLSMGMVRRQVAKAQFKNDLVATVSHELKTPVTSIRLLVETLLNDPNPRQEKLRDYLDLISNENHRLGHLVQRFLTFSRMERDENYFDFVSVPIGEILDEVEQAFRERFPSGGYKLTVDSECRSFSITADREALSSALGNLLENAYKYSDRDKQIVLRCFREGHNTVFEVEDNGVGIPKHERNRIFRKFYQPDRRLNKHKGGVGLGLSIVSLVVRAHKGNIQVESESGKGSCFRIIIPHA